ncbi:MAG: hypothetical protein WCR72_14820 [Bacteroidota bacterium]
MKRIQFAVLTLMICLLTATGFASNPSKPHTLFLQSTESKLSAVLLSQSAEIISARLKSFGVEKFDLKVLSGSSQIQLILENDADLQIIESLVTQRGKLTFSETYNSRELNELLNGDNTLLTLMNAEVPPANSARIGCTTADRMASVIEYLGSTGLKDKCSFAWSNLLTGSNFCLYALRTAAENQITLSGTDIESFEPKHSAAKNTDLLEFRFKKTAIPVWAAATKRNLNKSIAIVMDNAVMYAPMVFSEIEGGNCQISGDFTLSQLRYIAAIGGNGELPASFMVLK